MGQPHWEHREYCPIRGICRSLNSQATIVSVASRRLGHPWKTVKQSIAPISQVFVYGLLGALENCQCRVYPSLVECSLCAVWFMQETSHLLRLFLIVHYANKCNFIKPCKMTRVSTSFAYFGSPAVADPTPTTSVSPGVVAGVFAPSCPWPEYHAHLAMSITIARDVQYRKFSSCTRTFGINIFCSEIMYFLIEWRNWLFLNFKWWWLISEERKVFERIKTIRNGYTFSFSGLSP